MPTSSAKPSPVVLSRYGLTSDTSTSRAGHLSPASRRGWPPPVAERARLQNTRAARRIGPDRQALEPRHCRRDRRQHSGAHCRDSTVGTPPVPPNSSDDRIRVPGTVWGRIRHAPLGDHLLAPLLSPTVRPPALRHYAARTDRSPCD